MGMTQAEREDAVVALLRPGTPRRGNSILEVHNRNHPEAPICRATMRPVLEALVQQGRLTVKQTGRVNYYELANPPRPSGTR